MKKLYVYILVLLLTLPAFGQFWENPNQKPGHGLQISNTHHLGTAGGLVSFWLSNEGSGNKVFDLSENGNTGTFGAGAASPLWVPGKFGSALSFDGVDDYTLVANAPVVDYPFTIVVWAKAPDITATHVVLSINNDAENDVQCYVGFSGAAVGDPVTAAIRNGGSFVAAESSIAYTANKLHQIVGVFTHSTLRSVYLDGGGLGTNTDAQITGGAWNNVGIGCLRDSTPTYYTSIVSCAMIYNRVLSTSEIALLYRESFCMFEPSWNWVLYGGISVPPVGGGQVIFIN